MNSSSNSSKRLIPEWLKGPWGRIGIGFLVYVLIYLFWLGFHWGGEENVTLIGDLFYLPMDLIVAVAALKVSLQKNLKPEIRRMWLFLGLGFTFYFVGDSIWTYLENFLEVPPFPSIADLFYLLFLPFATFGLGIYSRTLPSRKDSWRDVSDFFVVLITSSMLMWYFVIQPTALANAGDLLSQSIAVAYPIMDVILIGGIVSVLLRRPDRDSRSAIWLLFLGMLFFVSTDILYAYFGLQGTYATGSWIDGGWLLGQAFFLLSAIRQMHQGPVEAQDSPSQIVFDKIIGRLPDVVVLIGGMVTILVVAINFDPEAGWLLSGAGLSISLLILRNFEQFSYRTKFIAVFSLSSTLIAFIIGFYYYNTQANQSLQDFRKIAKTSISIAALQQNGDEFVKISSAQDPLYEKLRLQNLKIRYSNPDFIYLYTMRKDSEGIYFVVDAGEPGEENIAPFGERYIDPSPTLLENFDTLAEPIADSGIYTDEYGSFLSAYAPILNSSGERVGVIAVDIDARTIIATRNKFLIQTTIIILAAGLASLLIGLFLGKLLVTPILSLTTDTNKFIQGDLNFRTAVSTKDEIGDLGLAFNKMAEQIQDLVSGLESKIASRTGELNDANRQISRRSKQFEAVAQVARSISTTLNLESLLPQITSLISNEFDVYHVGIFLLDDRREYAVLSAANSEGGQKMLDRNHRLRIGETGIVGYVTSAGKARVALDTGKDAVFFNNPDLPETRSEIALPLRIGEEIIGALDVQSTEPSAFDRDDIDVLETLADQVSIAIQNARQYEATRRALTESEILSSQFVQSGWQQFTRRQKLVGIRHTGAKASLLYAKKKGKGDGTGALNRDQARPKARGASLSLPVKLRGEVIGSVEVRSQSNRQFDQDELDIVNAIIERAAIAMENARLLAESQKRAVKERTIGEISAKLSAQSDLNDLLKTAAKELNRTLPGAEIAIQLNQSQEAGNA